MDRIIDQILGDRIAEARDELDRREPQSPWPDVVAVLAVAVAVFCFLLAVSQAAEALTR